MIPKDKNILYKFYFFNIYIYISKKEGNYLFKTQFRK